MKVTREAVALFIERDTAARGLAFATAAVAVVAEAWATAESAGQGRLARLRGLAEGLRVTALAGTRGRTPSEDRRTREVLLVGVLVGLVVMVALARDLPGLRFGANGWAGVAVGLVIAWAGIGLRVWAVKTLGRFFQRRATVEASQEIVRSGPYRYLRHPAYAGNLLTFLGLGVAIGSVVGAFVGTAIMLAAHLPRIWVEERMLAKRFGAAYAEHEAATDRVIPGVW